jgi:hypothetical protein
MDKGTAMPDNLIDNHSFNAPEAVVIARHNRTLKQDIFNCLHKDRDANRARVDPDYTRRHCLIAMARHRCKFR